MRLLFFPSSFLRLSVLWGRSMSPVFLCVRALRVAICYGCFPRTRLRVVARMPYIFLFRLFSFFFFVLVSFGPGEETFRAPWHSYQSLQMVALIRIPRDIDGSRGFFSFFLSFFRFCSCRNRCHASLMKIWFRVQGLLPRSPFPSCCTAAVLQMASYFSLCVLSCS